MHIFYNCLDLYIHMIQQTTSKVLAEFFQWFWEFEIPDCFRINFFFFGNCKFPKLYSGIFSRFLSPLFSRTIKNLWQKNWLALDAQRLKRLLIKQSYWFQNIIFKDPNLDLHIMRSNIIVLLPYGWVGSVWGRGTV